MTFKPLSNCRWATLLIEQSRVGWMRVNEVVRKPPTFVGIGKTGCVGEREGRQRRVWCVWCVSGVSGVWCALKSGGSILMQCGVCKLQRVDLLLSTCSGTE